MPRALEKIIIDRMYGIHGWTKQTDSNNQHYRVIRLGNEKNCNGEIMKNFAIKRHFLDFIEKYEITDYDLEEIDTEYEFSFQLKLSIETYDKLYEKIETMVNEKIKNTKKDNNTFNPEVVYY